jgi:hypothetical protein
MPCNAGGGAGRRGQTAIGKVLLAAFSIVEVTKIAMEKARVARDQQGKNYCTLRTRNNH